MQRAFRLIGLVLTLLGPAQYCHAQQQIVFDVGNKTQLFIDRLLVGITDLLGMLWLRRRASRPRLIGESPPAESAAAPRPAAQPAEPAL